MLSFNEERHEYRWNGVVVPSVTQLLNALHSFAGVPWDVLEAARLRGTRVHKACELFDLDDLDEEALAADLPQVVPYLEAWKKFVRDCEPNWEGIEEQVYHPSHRYAGTLDRRGELTVGGQRIQRAVVDIKTAVDLHPVWGVQTMAYSRACDWPDARRFSCQLREDGTYRLREWTDPNDWPVFVSLTTLNAWKARHL